MIGNSGLDIRIFFFEFPVSLRSGFAEAGTRSLREGDIGILEKNTWLRIPILSRLRMPGFEF